MRPVPGSPPVTSNFTVSDLIGVGEAFFLFPLFTLIPGYVCGWLVDACGFRRLSLLARLALSVALSIGVSPILAYLLWHWSISAVWTVFGATWIGFVVLVFYERQIWSSRPALSRQRLAFIGIVAGWIVLGTLSLIDLQFKDRLYFSMVAYDYTFRTAVTAAITRTGIPPLNPYFFPGRPFVLRYHYFWFILCSLVNQIDPARVSPREAMMAGTLWSGIGLIAMIPLYLRFFQPKGAKNLDRRTLFGVGLLSVGGLSIVPVFFLDVLSRNILLPDMGDVVPLPGQALWVPHHVAALVACLSGFLLLWFRRGLQGARGDILAATGAGVTFACALGLSVYVTLVVAVFMTAWTAIDALRRQFREVGLTCVAGIVALAFSLPYVTELLGERSNPKAGGGPLLQFAIRMFSITHAVISTSHPAEWVRPLAEALALPLAYFLELGFFFLVGLLQWRKMRASKPFLGHPELCGFVMVASGLFVCSFLRSSVISANDLGIRGFMVVQFVLLLWGAECLDDGLLSQSRRNLLVATLVLGVAGTVYDVGIFRAYTIIADNSAIPRFPWLSQPRQLGSQTFALRQLYEELKGRLPQTAVIQHNPDADPGDVPYGLYADRQVAAETLNCGAVFGGDPMLCERIIGPIDDLFEKPEGVAARQVDAVCKDLSIDALIVKDTDPVWADGNSWVWKLQPVIANRYARAFVCGGRSDP